MNNYEVSLKSGNFIQTLAKDVEHAKRVASGLMGISADKVTDVKKIG